MPMYNLIEYSENYSKTSVSLWNYYRDEPKSGVRENNYKTSITEKLEDNNITKNVEITVPLKY